MPPAQNNDFNPDPNWNASIWKIALGTGSLMAIAIWIHLVKKKPKNDRQSTPGSQLRDDESIDSANDESIDSNDQLHAEQTETKDEKENEKEVHVEAKITVMNDIKENVRERKQELHSQGIPSIKMKNKDPPAAEFICPITHVLMQDPVCCEDGHTYERKAILHWLGTHNTSPLTREPLASKKLIPNHALRAQIVEYRRKHNLKQEPPWLPPAPERPQPLQQQTVLAVSIDSDTMPQMVPHTRQHFPDPVPRTGSITVQHFPFGGNAVNPFANTPSSGCSTSSRMSHPAGVMFQQSSGSSSPTMTMPLPHGPLAQGFRELLMMHPEIIQQYLPSLAGNGFPIRQAVDAIMRSPDLIQLLFPRMIGQTPTGQQIFHQMQQRSQMLRTGGATEERTFTLARMGDITTLERTLMLEDKRANDSKEPEQKRMKAVEKVNQAGDTLLHVACWAGRLRVVQMLLAKKSNVNARSRNRSCPLTYACWQGNLEIVKTLIAHGAIVDCRMDGGDTPLHQSSWNGHTECCHVLIDHKADIESTKEDGGTPLHLSATRNKSDVTKLLLQRRANVKATDLHGNTPIHTAATMNSTDVIGLLIDNKADINIANNLGQAALLIAVARHHSKAVSELLKRGASAVVTTREGDVPLHIAAKLGLGGICSSLLEYKADLNTLTRTNRMTPLHVACLSNSGDAVVRILCKAKAMLNAKDASGLTPLHWACKHNTRDVVTVLLDSKANIEDKTQTMGTPLHVAVQHQREPTVLLLLERTADVNAIRNGNNTPLHSAASSGNVQIVQDLLAAKANPEAHNIGQATPIALARRYGYKSCEQHLQKKDH